MQDIVPQECERNHREVDFDVNILGRIINNLSKEDGQQLDFGLHDFQRQSNVLVPPVVEVPFLLQVFNEIPCERHAEIELPTRPDSIFACDPVHHGEGP